MNRTVREYVEQVKREDFIREEPEQTSEATATEEEEGLNCLADIAIRRGSEF